MKEQIILTGSCYWCLEAIFQKVRGVLEVESGIYHIDDYNFSFGKNDKLEAIRLTYEPGVLSLENLFSIFYLTHNPTAVKWQKDDCFFPLCRSAVFYFSQEQKNALEKTIARLEDEKVYEEFSDPIQTKCAQIIPENFFLAEEKYRDFFNKNPNEGFCVSIITPKMNKLKELYKNQINNM